VSGSCHVKRGGSIYRYIYIYINILRQYDNRHSDPGTYRLHVINVFYSKIPWNNLKTNKSVQNIHSNYLNSICSMITWHIKCCVVPERSVLYFKDFEVKHSWNRGCKVWWYNWFSITSVITLFRSTHNCQLERWWISINCIVESHLHYKLWFLC
jgi:hypothetical protein